MIHWCLRVRAYGQGVYFGQAPVNDIKSVGVTVAKTEKRERGRFMRQERAADRAASKVTDGIKSKQMCEKEKG